MYLKREPDILLPSTSSYPILVRIRVCVRSLLVFCIDIFVIVIILLKSKPTTGKNVFSTSYVVRELKYTTHFLYNHVHSK